jgi:hypothetical protein
MKERQQYTWTVLPQRFRDSLHQFARELGKDWRDLQMEEGVLFQYVDDFLICSPTQDISNANTVLVLTFLADRRYTASKSKAQIFLQDIHYLGYILTPGAWRLTAERIEALCTLGVPMTEHQLHLFLAMAGFCQIWISNFGVIEKPLYEVTK